MSFFVVTKKIPNEGNAYMPTYEIVHEKPGSGVKYGELTPGDYTYVGKCSLNTELAEITAEIYKVSNVGGKVVEEHVETFTMERL